MQANQRLGASFTLANAPASGATAVLFDSGSQAALSPSIVRLSVAVNSSADSAANGLTFEASWDNGTTWDTFKASSYTTVSGMVLVHAARAGERVRVRFANSAATLTTFRGEVRLHSELGNL